MKIRKLTVAVAAILIMAFSLTGCVGNFYPVAMTIDGQEISPGMYLFQQLEAYYEADDLAENKDKDPRNQKIEGVNGKKWIKQEAVKNCKEFVSVQRLAEEYGVTLSDDSLSALAQNAFYWSLTGDIYANNGVSYETYEEGRENAFLKDDLFKTLYGEGGEKAWSREELDAAVAEQFAPIRYFYINLKDSEGNSVEDLDAFKEAMAKALEKLNNGQITLDEMRDMEAPGLYKMLGAEFAADTDAQIVVSHISYDTTRDSFYTDEWMDALKNMAVGQAATHYTENSTVLIYQKVAPFNGEDEEYESSNVSLVRQLRYDEYEDFLAEAYNGYTTSILFGMQLFYRPAKIVR